MTRAEKALLQKIIVFVQDGGCLCDEQPCWGSRRPKGQVCSTRETIVEEIHEKFGSIQERFNDIANGRD